MGIVAVFAASREVNGILRETIALARFTPLSGGAAPYVSSRALTGEDRGLQPSPREGVRGWLCLKAPSTVC